MNYKKAIFLIIYILSISTSFGQYYDTEFGQNRIQYKKFNWLFYTTSHFDVYYYDEGGRYAKEAIDYLEDEFNRLTDLLGYAPSAKTKIVIYNSYNDLQQSNIGIDGSVFTIGGEMEFIKLQLEIANPGTVQVFKEELIYLLSRTLINDMLFGGSLREVFQSSHLLKLPEWFIDGAARYLAYGWDLKMDDFIRDYLDAKHIKKEKKIQGDQAGVLGQAIWNYIAIKYGASNISNILNLTRIMHKEDVSISNTLGISYKQFSKNWKNYYAFGKDQIDTNYEPLIKEKIIATNKKENLYFNDVAVSESGKYIAYTENLYGKISVYLRDRDTGNETRILQGGYQVEADHMDQDLPLLDFAGDNILGIIYFKRGFLYLASYHIETGLLNEKPLTRFNQIKSFSLNQNGRLAIISGDTDGKSDLFLVSVLRNSVRRITSDIFDDIDPTFIPGTAAIVFSSNRPSDALNISDTSIKYLNDHFNLFLYDIDTTTQQYFRMTNTNTRDTKPIFKNQSELYFLSDQRGITNVFKYEMTQGIQTQVTNFNSSLKDFDLHFSNDNGMVFIAYNEGEDHIYYYPNIDIESSKFTTETNRQKIRQGQYIAEVLDRRKMEKLKREKAVRNAKADSLLNQAQEKSLDLDSTSKKVNVPVIGPEGFVFDEPNLSENTDYIDTENYNFGEREVKGKPNNGLKIDSFFKNYQRLTIENEVWGPRVYKPRFSSNNLINDFVLDPLRGFGFSAEIQVSDILGNHVINAGGMVTRSFDQGDFFAEYKYLKYWMDFKVRLIRQSIYLENDAENFLRQSYKLNGLIVGAAVPLTNKFRLELNPFFQQTSFNNLQYESVNTNAADYAKDSRILYTGFQLRGVFDNTKERGFNILQGTRALVEFHYNQSFSKNQSFNVFRFDLRHYQIIHNELTLATRIYMGKSFGPNPQKFLLGGVPNWVLARTKEHSGGDPLTVANEIDNSNLLFTEFVNQMRGYDLNEKYGTAALLVNMELKFPVFQYLSRFPVKSTFLRNFMLVAFTDIGSAWDGKIPITRKNSIIFIDYDETPFKAKVANYASPWLASYGFGLRTALLGYYLKLDYARPLEDFEIKSAKFTLSLGLDF